MPRHLSVVAGELVERAKTEALPALSLSKGRRMVKIEGDIGRSNVRSSAFSVQRSVRKARGQ
jgi:hypothetical protein